MSSSALNQNYQYVFTVFTAAYNREHTLHRVYESLKEQTYRDFEWLIVDDGSTDNTCELVEQWRKDNQFSIRYIYQENQGKHIAFNRGLRGAKGEFFLNLDSDDGCVPQALERLKYHWDTIPKDQKNNFSGVVVLCQDQDGKLDGSRFPFNPTDCSVQEMRYKFKVLGEKWGFNRTEVLRQFPVAEKIKGEIIPDGLRWNKIGKKYKTRYVNEILRIYWKGEPSWSRDFVQNPGANATGRRIAHLTVLNEDLNWLLIAPFAFLRSAINYSRFSFHLGLTLSDQPKDIDTAIGKILWLINLPLGYSVYLRDKTQTTTNRPSLNGDSCTTPRKGIF